MSSAIDSPHPILKNPAPTRLSFAHYLWSNDCGCFNFPIVDSLLLFCGVSPGIWLGQSVEQLFVVTSSKQVHMVNESIGHREVGDGSKVDGAQ